MNVHIGELFAQIIHKPLGSLAVIGNLILIESLLSVDNAAVIATMVLDLSGTQRKRALSYGIVGAYIFRGVCLFFAAFLIRIWWLKPLAGLYLLYLFVKYFIARRKTQRQEVLDKKKNPLYKQITTLIGPFWATVLLVETMDLVFSIDNVFAAVAFTNNILLVWTGVFIGILAMRIVARAFVHLMEIFPFLETSAYIVLGILGLKLSFSLTEHFYPHSPFNAPDWVTSVLTIVVFIVPLLSSLLFNFPKKKEGK